MGIKQETNPDDRLRELIDELQQLAQGQGYGSIVQLVKDGVIEYPDTLREFPTVWREKGDFAVYCMDARGAGGTYRLTASEEDLSWSLGVRR